MPDRIAARLAALPMLGKPALCDLWKQVFSTSTPPKLRRDLMISILAYRVQEQAFGSLSAASCGRLRQLAKAFESDSNAAIPSVSGIKPGTRLVRQWGDQVHLVNVEANGYVYRGIHYQNLSEIARLITGTRWSGPRFFGIKIHHTNKLNEAA